MQIHVEGVKEEDREALQRNIISAVHEYGIDNDLWTWDYWEDSVGGGATVQLPGTPEIRDAIHRGLLETISSRLPGVAVSVPNAPRNIL